MGQSESFLTESIYIWGGAAIFPASLCVDVVVKTQKASPALPADNVKFTRKLYHCVCVSCCCLKCCTDMEDMDTALTLSFMLKMLRLQHEKLKLHVHQQGSGCICKQYEV